MKTRCSSIVSLGLVAAAVLLPLRGTGQGLPETEALLLDSMIVPAGANFSITFMDSGTGQPDYVLEFTPELGAGADWSVVSQAPPADLGGGRHQFTVSKPVGFGAYRVMAYNESAPLEVQFSTPSVSLVEEDGVSYVLLTFSKPHTGVINYSMSGTATGGVISPLTGSVDVNGRTFARIALQLSDDLDIGEIKFLNLSLDGAGVGLGTVNQILITVAENDALWTGAFVGEDLEFSFTFELYKNAAGYSGNLVSDGNGLIPAGSYPAAVTFNDTRFQATVSGITMPADASLLGAASSLGLSLDSTAGGEGQSVADDQIQGLANISTVYSAKPFLNTTIAGEFGLVKSAVSPSTAEVNLE